MEKGKKRIRMIVAGLLFVSSLIAAPFAFAAQNVTWGAASSAIYDLTNPGTILMYKSELSQGGMNLSTKTFVDGKSGTADLVFDASGSTIGAVGVYDMGKVDFDSVTTIPDSGYATEASAAAGHVYVIMTHDGNYAKIGISAIVGSRLSFNYALQNAGGSSSGGSGPANTGGGSAANGANGSTNGTGNAGTGTTNNTLNNSTNNTSVKTTNNLTNNGFVNNGTLNNINNSTNNNSVNSNSGNTTSINNIYNIVNNSNSNNTNNTNSNNSNMNSGNNTNSGNSVTNATTNTNSNNGNVSNMNSNNAIDSNNKTSTTHSVDSNNTTTTTTTVNTSIVLTLGNPEVAINGNKKTLEVPPQLDGDYTLVPLRFVGEALGAKVDWNGDDQSVTLTLNGKVIILFINTKEASINGNQVELDAPAKIIDGNTMVPLRFVGEALDQKVNYDGATKQITLQPASASDSAKPSAGEGQTPANNDDLSYFFHSYKLEVPGVAYQTDNGYYSTLNISSGAVAGSITINSDGTWIWNSSWDEKLEKGKWTRSSDSGYPILIKNGEDGEDWLIGKGTKESGSDIIAWDPGKSIWKYGYKLEAND